MSIPHLCTIVAALSVATASFAQPGFQFVGSIESGGYQNNAHSVVVDASGAIYMAGGIGGSTVDLDPGSGFVLDTVNAGSNPFLIRTDSLGNLVWKAILKCSEWSEVTELQADQQGNLIACGYFSGTMDLDPSAASYDVTTSNSSNALFLVKITAGGSFVWGRTIETSGGCYPSALMVSDSSYIYFAGHFHGSGDFDPGPGQHTITSGTKQGMFISKLNSAGNFLNVNYFGEVALAFVTGIVNDQNGGIIAAGYFQDTLDIDPGAGLYRLTSIGYSGFFTRLDNSGNFVSGGTIGDSGSNLTIAHLGRDNSGNYYIGGTFNGPADMDPGSLTFSVQPPAGISMFITKYDLYWKPVWLAVGQGSLSTDVARVTDISVDVAGNVYCTGIFKGNCDFDPGPGTQMRYAKSWDIFISKLKSDGSFGWTINFGGTIDPAGHWPDDLGSAIAVRPGAKIINVGRYTYGTDFDPGPTTYSLSAFDGNLYLYVLSENSTVLGLKKAESTSRMFWPNPSNGGLVKFEETLIRNISVYDALGNKLPVSTENGIINLSAYSKGIYFCTFDDESRQARNTKLIKD